MLELLNGQPLSGSIATASQLPCGDTYSRGFSNTQGGLDYLSKKAGVSITWNEYLQIADRETNGIRYIITDKGLGSDLTAENVTYSGTIASNNVQGALNTLNENIVEQDEVTEVTMTLNTSNCSSAPTFKCRKNRKRVYLNIDVIVTNTTTNFQIASGLPLPYEPTTFVAFNNTQQKAIRCSVVSSGSLYFLYNNTGSASGDELNICFSYLAK